MKEAREYDIVRKFVYGSGRRSANDRAKEVEEKGQAS